MEDEKNNKRIKIKASKLITIILFLFPIIAGVILLCNPFRSYSSNIELDLIPFFAGISSIGFSFYMLKIRFEIHSQEVVITDESIILSILKNPFSRKYKSNKIQFKKISFILIDFEGDNDIRIFKRESNREIFLWKKIEQNPRICKQFDMNIKFERKKSKEIQNKILKILYKKIPLIKYPNFKNLYVNIVEYSYK